MRVINLIICFLCGLAIGTIYRVASKSKDGKELTRDMTIAIVLFCLAEFIAVLIGMESIPTVQ